MSHDLEIIRTKFECVNGWEGWGVIMYADYLHTFSMRWEVEEDFPANDGELMRQLIEDPPCSQSAQFFERMFSLDDSIGVVFDSKHKYNNIWFSQRYQEVMDENSV